MGQGLGGQRRSSVLARKATNGPLPPGPRRAWTRGSGDGDLVLAHGWARASRTTCH